MKRIDLLRSASAKLPQPIRHVVLGNPANRRIAFFQDALARNGLPAARVISYVDLLDGTAPLAALFTDTDVLRIESPGEDFDVERRLIARGAEHPQLQRSERVSRQAALTLAADHGRLRLTRQWYLGFRSLLREIEEGLKRHSAVRLHNAPANIELMFDKPQCQRRLRDAGVPVAEMLDDVHNYGDLVARAREQNWNRLFVKLAHGSSASGVVALHLAGPQVRAVTSVEMVSAGGQIRFYNNLRIRTYTDPADVACIVDYICGERAQIERWLPKASLDGRNFDLRILVIGGQVRHTVVRTSMSPMTNLHLGNQRGDLDELRSQLTSSRWREITHVAEAAAQQFPQSLYVGVDLLLTPGFQNVIVLEANAFGDLLPGVQVQGLDTYDAEIATAVQ